MCVSSYSTCPSFWERREENSSRMLRICVPSGRNSLLCRDWSQVQLLKETAFQISFWHSETCRCEFPPPPLHLAPSWPITASIAKGNGLCDCMRSQGLALFLSKSWGWKFSLKPVLSPYNSCSLGLSLSSPFSTPYCYLALQSCLHLLSFEVTEFGPRPNVL